MGGSFFFAVLACGAVGCAGSSGKAPPGQPRAVKPVESLAAQRSPRANSRRPEPRGPAPAQSPESARAAASRQLRTDAAPRGDPYAPLTVIRGPQPPAAGQAAVLKLAEEGDVALRRANRFLREGDNKSAAAAYQSALARFSAAAAEARKAGLKGLAIKYRLRAREAARGSYLCLREK